MQINLNGQLYNSDFDAGMASIVDSTSTAGYVYFCDALPGSSTAAAAWRISRLNTTTGQTMWVNGDAGFSNVAANRTSLSYS